MKTVILAGGLGTRISEETMNRPKPFVEIGGMPIIWHIMKSYSYYGYNEFIICAGYRQDFVKDWFSQFFIHSSDVTFDYTGEKEQITVHENRTEPWKVTVVDTGLNTMTGGRLGRVKRYIGDETFMLTYGDGVCDVDISKLVSFHRSHGRAATLTAVRLEQEKGVLGIDVTGAVKSFREKNIRDNVPINAGFMVLEPKIFDYITGDETVLEREPLERLADEGELMSYSHKGFWQCMDNLREKSYLEELISTGSAPWIKW
ncbi:MAG: glucose-1-phosphate cytidylyltransferase [Lachnospiraceae bacterium]|nr:glucose-1-phosphate cytidylyltransferase [Lachnospiraceae bacterium]